jgi:hypothetical protein
MHADRQEQAHPERKKSTKEATSSYTCALLLRAGDERQLDEPRRRVRRRRRHTVETEKAASSARSTTCSGAATATVWPAGRRFRTTSGDVGSAVAMASSYVRRGCWRRRVRIARQAT